MKYRHVRKYKNPSASSCAVTILERVSLAKPSSDNAFFQVASAVGFLSRSTRCVEKSTCT